jgi:homoserine dehydrogenase
MIGVAVLGFGTVGSGVYEVLKVNADSIARKAGEELKVLSVLDLRDFPGNEVEKVLTHDYEDILNNDDIKIVAEVMGGVEPAFTFSKKALMKGKSVVTSNKAVVAAKGPELMKIAKENNANYLFEASCGGGIPIIRPLCVSLTADKINSVKGILNGTTNFILTKMTEEGSSFEDALKTAQKLGYAEADPTADVEGHDACRKIAILSSLAFGKTVDFEEIYTEGITKVTDKDIKYAKKINSVIKLIGSSNNLGDGISAKVAPFIISDRHPLASVNNAFNAIFVNGNMSGDTMYYGSGAGKLPTASAVTADIIDAAIHMGKNVPIDWDCDSKMKVYANDDVAVKGLVRAAYSDKAKAEEAVKEIFGVSEFICLDGENDEFAFITKEETEGSIKEKEALLASKEGISEIRNMIRVEG